MLILGIILTVLGLIVFRWAANAQSGSPLDRPLIFNNAIAVIIINLVWVMLFISGFYSLWQVNPIIVLIIFGVYAVLWILSRILGSEKAKAKKIFRIYKKLKLFRPKASDEEIFRETASVYFRSLRWSEDKIKMIVDAIFEKRVGSNENKDTKDLVSSILIFENPPNYLDDIPFSKRSLKRTRKRQKAIKDAHNDIIDSTLEVTKRPELSSQTIKWINSLGLNPDEMTNEQLAVFSEIDDHSKSNWAVRAFYVFSFGCLVLLGIKLISLEFGSVLIYGLLFYAFWYIGNKIQMRRVNKKFHEATIMKYAEEQAREVS